MSWLFYRLREHSEECILQNPVLALNGIVSYLGRTEDNRNVVRGLGIRVSALLGTLGMLIGEENLRAEETIDEIEGYREIIKENIEYDSLLLAHPYDQEMVEGIFDLILETVLSKNGEITIAGDVYPKNLVKSKFLKLNYSHVEYVINCLGKNTTKVRNIKSYLLASLFNAGSTISSYYRAEVNHGMPQYAG